MLAHKARLRLVLLYGLLLTPWVGYGTWCTLQGNSNSPLNWVSKEYPARATYNEFCDLFGQGDVVVISWPGCTIQEARPDQLAQALRTASGFFDAQGKWYFDQVTSGRELVHLLTRPINSPDSASPPDLPITVSPLDLATAADRLRGILVGPDGQTTCLVIGFTAEGLKVRNKLVPLIKSAASHYCGIPHDQLHLAGPVVDGLAVDLASQRALNRLAAPSALVVLLLAWVGLRSFRAALVVFGVAAAGQALTLALVHYCGDQMSALLIVLPPLVQVLAVSGGIHLTNYYFDAPSDLTSDEALQLAVRRAWLPCTLSAVTTAIGLVSLTISQLEPIRKFGGYAAAGVLATAALTLTVIPAALMLWPLPDRRRTRRSQENDRIWRWLSNLTAKHHQAVTACCGLLLVACCAVVFQLNTSVRIETLFSPSSRIMNDYAWLEQHVRPLASLEVDLAIHDDCQLDLPERMKLLWRVQQAAGTDPEVLATATAFNFMPELALNPDQPINAQQLALESALRNLCPSFSQLNFLRSENGIQHWRLMALTSAIEPVDYGELLNRVRERIKPVLFEITKQSDSEISLNMTGVMPLVHQIQNQLLEDLYKSFLGAVGIVTVVMTLAEAGILAGLVVMVPNLFPILLVFGILAWTGTALDIGSVMTASIALGIAVDDTLHFTTTFRRELRAGQSRPAAVLATYRHCGLAMVQTTLCCGLGLLVFAISEFLPTQRFALMMAVLLGTALVGDLLLLPALLNGPLGRLFETEHTGAYHRKELPQQASHGELLGQTPRPRSTRLTA